MWPAGLLVAPSPPAIQTRGHEPPRLGAAKGALPVCDSGEGGALGQARAPGTGKRATMASGLKGRILGRWLQPSGQMATYDGWSPVQDAPPPRLVPAPIPLWNARATCQ